MKEQEEELLLKKRFMDLSRLADKRDIVTFSNFLNLNEINLFFQTTSELATHYRLFGGYEFAERQMPGTWSPPSLAMDRIQTEEDMDSPLPV